MRFLRGYVVAAGLLEDAESELGNHGVDVLHEFGCKVLEALEAGLLKVEPEFEWDALGCG